MAGTNIFIEQFFDQHPEFPHDRSRPIMKEFFEMVDFFDWDYEEKKDARDDLKEAMVEQFNHTYGVNEHSLEEWTGLCEVMGINPIPIELEACRKKVKGSFVNIVDLLDVAMTGVTPTLFRTEEALSHYSLSTGKIFPREHVLAGGLLKYLLRQIMNPHASPRGRGRGRGGGGGRSRGR